MIVNHSAVVNLLCVVNILRVVFLVWRGPLGKRIQRISVVLNMTSVGIFGDLGALKDLLGTSGTWVVWGLRRADTQTPTR